MLNLSPLKAGLSKGRHAQSEAALAIALLLVTILVSTALRG